MLEYRRLVLESRDEEITLLRASVEKSFLEGREEGLRVMRAQASGAEGPTVSSAEVDGLSAAADHGETKQVSHGRFILCLLSISNVTFLNDGRL